MLRTTTFIVTAALLLIGGSAHELEQQGTAGDKRRVCYEANKTHFPNCERYEAVGYTCVGDSCVSDRCVADCSLCARRHDDKVPDVTTGRCVAPVEIEPAEVERARLDDARAMPRRPHDTPGTFSNLRQRLPAGATDGQIHATLEA